MSRSNAAHVLLVVDNQDPSSLPVHAVASALFRRYGQSEDGPAIGRRDDRDFAAMGARDGACDREAEAAARRLRREERLEDSFPRGRCQAASRVVNLDADHAWGRFVDEEDDTALLAARLDRVGDQVGDDLPQLRLVGLRGSASVDLDADSGGHAFDAKGGHDVVDEGSNVHRRGVEERHRA